MQQPEIVFELAIRITKVDDETFVPGLTVNGVPVYMRSTATLTEALRAAFEQAKKIPGVESL